MSRPSQSQAFPLAASALLHVLVVLALAAGLVDPSSGGNAAALAVTPETMTFQLMDAPRQVVETPAREGEPDRPANLVSERSTASADRAPRELPEGEAYAEGAGAVPTPRPGEGGRDAAPGAPVPPRAEPSPPRAAAEPSPPARRGDEPDGARGDEDALRAPEAAADAALRRGGGRADEGREPGAASTLGDPRLAVPRREVVVPPLAGAGGAGARGMPQVDNRLTRARLEGDFSLSTYEWDYAPYMLRLKRRIEDYTWQILPSAFWYGIAAWATQVRFVIRPDGSLESVVISGHRGVLELRHVAEDAVTGAADFEPLPPGFPDPELTVTGNFYFNTFPPGDEEEEAGGEAAGEAPSGRGAGRS
jgi:hypothetical protein